MKKKFIILAVIALIVIVVGIVVAETIGGYSKPNQEPITLTTDNFGDYFAINNECTVNTTKNPGKTILGVYIPATYSAIANINLDIVPSRPLEAFGVEVTLEIDKWTSDYWETKTVTLFIDSSGRARRTLSVESIEVKENDYNRYASSHINNDRVGISVVSVTGTILPK